MKILQVSAGSVSALFLVVLMVGSASAAPLLGIGSNANYSLNATTQATQSCNALPVSYNQTACGPYQPRALVSIYDDGVCALNSPACHFWPANQTVAPGTTVMWFNYGKMFHTVTSTSNVAGLSSPLLKSNASFTFTFTNPGTYNYSCSIHPWMHGTVTVATPTYSPPTATSTSYMPAISLDGSIGWTVIGLDNNVAVLNVSHQVSIVASVGLASFTPVTETGSFSQSINLATRVESSGTATSLILSILQRMLASLGPTGSSYGTGVSPALTQMLSDPKTVYTIWWANGPLANGQPVQVLTGYASVTGSETVNLGPGNSRNAWIVESELSQSLSTSSPPIIGSGASTDSSFKLDLRFDYDQASDLLLKSSALVSVTSAQTQMYNPGDYLCGSSGCFPVLDHVTVNHHASASLSVTLQLKSTSLNLSKRDPQGTGNGLASLAASLLSPMSLWITTGAGVVGAGAAVTLAWLLRRRTRMRAPAVQPGPIPSASLPLPNP